MCTIKKGAQAVAGQALYKLANGLAAELKSYGISNNEMDSLKAAADKFALLNPEVRKVRLDKRPNWLNSTPKLRN